MLKTVKLELQTDACTTFCAVYKRGFFYRSHFTGHDYRSLFCGLVTKSKSSSFCLKYILVSNQSFTLWPVKCDLLKSIICIHCKSLLKQVKQFTEVSTSGDFRSGDLSFCANFPYWTHHILTIFIIFGTSNANINVHIQLNKDNYPQTSSTIDYLGKGAAFQTGKENNRLLNINNTPSPKTKEATAYLIL